MIEEGELIAALRLSRTRRIGPIAYRELLRRFGTAQAALQALPMLARRGGGDAPAIPSLATIERERAAVAALGASYLVRGQAGYPALLAELENAPSILIVRGDTGLLLRPTVAMVGARNASAAAIRFARELAHDLAANGFTVVSGLARGIDAAAHQGSLAGGTVGVIAGGPDVVYPPEHHALQEAVATQGLLVAEQPPGTEPHARHFPFRNRIIAGLSSGTLVVEAAPRSGSLITARLAVEAGREVMAIPGSPLDPRAQGCNQLIRDGATLVQNAADVVETLQPFGAPRLRAPPPSFVAEPFGDVIAADRARIVGLLGPTAVPVDELLRQTGIAPAALQLVLLELELADRLDRHAGGKVSLR
jgi:DNA processing protein